MTPRPRRAPAHVVVVGLREIADLLAVKPATADVWSSRGLLPAPRWTVSSRPAWDWADIHAWARETGRLP